MKEREKLVCFVLVSGLGCRYLEAAYWKMEGDGKRVVDTLEESIAWRESVRAHKLRKEDVIVRGAKGAILVKGHDLQR